MPRVRNRTKSNYYPLTTLRNSGGVPLSSSTSYASDVVTEFMVDEVSAGWPRTRGKPISSPPILPELVAKLGGGHQSAESSKFKRLTNGISRVQVLNYDCSSVSQPTGNIVFSVTGNPNWVAGSGCILSALLSSWVIGGSPPSVTMPSTASYEREVKSTLLTLVSNPSFSFGEPIAEVRRTTEMLRDPLLSIKDLANDFSREIRRYPHLKRAARIAAVWKAYRFGFAPLVRTADDALQALADGLYRKSKPEFKRHKFKMEATGRATSLATHLNKNFPFFGYTTVKWNVQVERVRVIKREISCGIHYYHADAGSLQTLLGLRARDIPAVLWETFPLSFMFDRLYNVRGMLQASSSFLSSNVKFTGGWQSVRETIEDTTRIVNIQGVNAGGKAAPSTTNPSVATNFSFDRSLWSPSIGDALPPFEAKGLVDTMTKQLDLASIVIGKISNAVRR